MKQVEVIKTGRRPAEPFSPEKLHRSIYAAALSVKVPKGSAEQIADVVREQVEQWIENKEVITSQDIRRVASRYLKSYHPDIAYIYEQYRHII